MATPWTMREGVLQDFVRNHPQWKFLQCDKNTGHPMIMCQCLYTQCLLENYSGEKQFETISTYESMSCAQQHAMHLLRSKAIQAGLGKVWKSGQSKSAPVSFILPKNKSNEFANKLGFRTLLLCTPTSVAMHTH